MRAFNPTRRDVDAWDRFLDRCQAFLLGAGLMSPGRWHWWLIGASFAFWGLGVALGYAIPRGENR